MSELLCLTSVGCIAQQDGENEVIQILGQPCDARVFTGWITKVGQKHIEYDISTFSGCSGAGVFLLDEKSANHCKVIAVHAGHQIALKTNTGFKILGCPGWKDHTMVAA